MHGTANGPGQSYKTAHIARATSPLRVSVLCYLNLLRRMSKLVWHPKQTRDVDETDGYGVRIQRCGVSFWIENKWRTIPANYWAWTFVATYQNSGTDSFGFWDDGDDVDGLGVWVPKVILSTEPGSILF